MPVTAASALLERFADVPERTPELEHALVPPDERDLPRVHGVGIEQPGGMSYFGSRAPFHAGGRSPTLPCARRGCPGSCDRPIVRTRCPARPRRWRAECRRRDRARTSRRTRRPMPAARRPSSTPVRAPAGTGSAASPRMTAPIEIPSSRNQVLKSRPPGRSTRPISSMYRWAASSRRCVNTEVSTTTSNVASSKGNRYSDASTEPFGWYVSLRDVRVMEAECAGFARRGAPGTTRWRRGRRRTRRTCRARRGSRAAGSRPGRSRSRPRGCGRPAGDRPGRACTRPSPRRPAGSSRASIEPTSLHEVEGWSRLPGHGDGTGTGVVASVGATLYLELMKRCLTRSIFPTYSHAIGKVPPEVEEWLEVTGYTVVAARPVRPDRVRARDGLAQRRRDHGRHAAAREPPALRRRRARTGCARRSHRDGRVARRRVHPDARRARAPTATRERRVWVADSFEGLPRPMERYPAGPPATRLHRVTDLAVSLDTVKANFGRYGLLDDQVRFLKGWFRDTLPRAPLGAAGPSPASTATSTSRRWTALEHTLSEALGRRVPDRRRPLGIGQLPRRGRRLPRGTWDRRAHRAASTGRVDIGRRHGPRRREPTERAPAPAPQGGVA